MTQPIDTERPHEFDPVDSSETECECGKLREAAVHQVAKKCVNHCIHDLAAMRDGTCNFTIGVIPDRLHGDIPSVCGHRCTFAPAEVHQTPERECKADSCPFDLPHPHSINDHPQMPPPPNQHVAPPRIWIHQLIEDGFIEREWSQKPSPAPYHESIEYLAAAPIQAALEKCERHCVTYDRSINIRNEDWDALVAAVKGDASGK